VNERVLAQIALYFNFIVQADDMHNTSTRLIPQRQ
jgi:hypothetical protein